MLHIKLDPSQKKGKEKTKEKENIKGARKNVIRQEKESDRKETK